VDIAVVGPGSLGIVVASALARAGNGVVVFGRGDAVERLRREGAVVHGIEEWRMPVSATDDARELGAPDLLLVCTKALGTPQLLECLRSVPASAVASLQNGMLKDRLLADVFGWECVVGAATLLSAERHSDGSVTLASRGSTYFGEPKGGVSDRVERLAKVWEAAGLPSAAVPDVRVLEWSKTAMVLGSFTVGVVSRLPMWQVFADPDLCDVFLALVQEGACVAKAAGVEVADFSGLPVGSYARLPKDAALELLARASANLSRAPVPLRASMQQDLLAGRALEVEEVFGYVVDQARSLGVPVPLLTMAYHLLRALDRNRF
jgi:2-dehydropantoate 2-reductase